MRKAEKTIITIFCIIYGGGVIAHLSPFLFPLAHTSTEVLLYVSNAIVLYFVLKENPSPKLLWWIVIAAVVTFFIESTGVATGKVFGPYEYGETLRLKALGVPFVIGLNWVMLTLGGFAIVQNVFYKTVNPVSINPIVETRPTLSLQSGLFISFITAITVVAFDWVMEPIAIWLDYWHWFDAPIPLQNYFAWFVISFVATLVLQQLNLRIQSKLLMSYFVIQLIFFVLLRIFGEVLST